MEDILESKPVLWIDDQKKIFNYSIHNFSQEGIAINGIDDPNVAEKEIKTNLSYYSSVFLDLELKHEINGIDLLKEIKKNDPLFPVVIVSAKLEVNEWKEKLKKVEREISETIEKIAKPFPLTTSKKFKAFKNMLYGKVIKHEKLINNPFCFSLDEYYNLSPEEIRILNKSASRLTKKIREEYFERKDYIDWIIIAHDKNNIIQEGQYRNIPTGESMKLLAKEQNAPVFGYSRPKLIEESEKVVWKQIKEDDYYPTINIFISDQNIFAHFDTGSPFSFISYEYLLENKLIENLDFQFTSEDRIYGREYQYHSIDLNFKLNKKEEHNIFFIKIEAVIDWSKSPLTRFYADRLALVGRNLLINNSLKLLLDGKNKTTNFISDEL